MMGTSSKKLNEIYLYHYLPTNMNQTGKYPQEKNPVHNYVFLMNLKFILCTCMSFLSSFVLLQ